MVGDVVLVRVEVGVGRVWSGRVWVAQDEVRDQVRDRRERIKREDRVGGAAEAALVGRRPKRRHGVVVVVVVVESNHHRGG